MSQEFRDHKVRALPSRNYLTHPSGVPVGANFLSMKRALELCANYADKAGNSCNSLIRLGQLPPPKPRCALTTAHAVIASVTISSVDIAHLRSVSVRRTHYRSASSPVSSRSETLLQEQCHGLISS